MKYIGVIILFICFLTFSCKTKEVISPNEYEGNRVLLSYGGGFTGKYKSYCLLDNGQLFKGSKQFEATSPIKGLEREITEQLFSNYDILGLGNEKGVSYSNMNYSIIMFNKDGKVHKLIWEKGQKGTGKLQLFYENIMNQIRLNNIDDDERTEAKAVQ